MEAFWAGERPDRIPYTIYQNEWRHVCDRPEWRAMYQAGLGVAWHLPTVKTSTTGVEGRYETSDDNGAHVARSIIRTDVRQISTPSTHGWLQKYRLETPEDYRVMTYIVEHTEVAPWYEEYHKREKEIGRHGIPMAYTGRTPMQIILVDYVGLENFALHLYDYEEEVLTLYEALLKQFRRRVEIVAEGPGRFVSCLENFTAETLGPKRFEQFLLPVYSEYFPMLRQAGKIVGTHYDGKLASCKEAIARAPVDLIESLTGPPEGDMTLAEARAAWPEKLFWANINVSLYQLPPAKLRTAVLDMVAQAAPDGRRLAFEVSEHLPANWDQAMPVVLDVLRETEA